MASEAMGTRRAKGRAHDWAMDKVTQTTKAPGTVARLFLGHKIFRSCTRQNLTSEYTMKHVRYFLVIGCIVNDSYAIPINKLGFERAGSALQSATDY